jgi:C4-type Zn-finger protein
MSRKSGVCTRCGVTNNDVVVRRMDGSSIWALDLDLWEEYPKTWAAPTKTVILSTGVCKHCARSKVLDDVVIPRSQP